MRTRRDGLELLAASEVVTLAGDGGREPQFESICRRNSVRTQRRS
jgi:hypothetical protein